LQSRYRNNFYTDFKQPTTWECDHRLCVQCYQYAASSTHFNNFFPNDDYRVHLDPRATRCEKMLHRNLICTFWTLGCSSLTYSTLFNHTQHHQPSSCLPHSQHFSLATLYPLPDKMEQLDRLNLFAAIVSQVLDTHRDSTYPGS